MQLSIHAIGRMKSGPEKQLLDHYCLRTEQAGRAIHLFGPSISEYSESRAQTAHLRKQEESKLLMNSMAKGSNLFVLDESGKAFTSENFATTIASLRDQGVPQLAIAIGGPGGHGPALLGQADEIIAFGRFTWPHQLARIMICEQLYRACTILAGHPYHRS